MVGSYKKILLINDSLFFVSRRTEICKDQEEKRTCTVAEQSSFAMLSQQLYPFFGTPTRIISQLVNHNKILITILDDTERDPMSGLREASMIQQRAGMTGGQPQPILGSESGLGPANGRPTQRRASTSHRLPTPRDQELWIEIPQNHLQSDGKSCDSPLEHLSRYQDHWLSSPSEQRQLLSQVDAHRRLPELDAGEVFCYLQDLENNNLPHQEGNSPRTSQ